MNSINRNLGFLILFTLVGFFFIWCSPFSQASDTWVFSGIRTNCDVFWSRFWTREGSGRTHYGDCLGNLEDRTLSVRYHIDGSGGDPSKDYSMKCEWDPLPEVLNPGETVEIGFSWSLIDGSYDYFEYGTVFYYGVDGSINHYEPLYGSTRAISQDSPSTKLIFEVPKVVKDEEFHITLVTHAGDDKEARITWVYRLAKNPVIFIPGIGGSILSAPDSLIAPQRWPKAPLGGDTELVLDEYGKSSANIVATDVIRYVTLSELNFQEDVYGSFLNTMKKWGYNEGYNLFLFPYDWRLSNYDHVEALEEKIDEALRKTGQKKVDIIAHSMGGIVARVFMDKKGTGKIDKFITMGTPHKGSVKPYYGFLEGYNFGNELKNKKLMKFISQNWPAGYELLPWEKFIKDESGKAWSLDESFAVNYHRTLYDMAYYDSDRWEWFLNPEMLEKAKAFRTELGTSAPQGVETYTIIGQRVATLSGFTAKEPKDWQPDNGVIKEDGSRWLLEPDLEKDFSDGDGTVPLWSATGLQNDKEFYIQDFPGDDTTRAEHGYLPLNKLVHALIKDILDGEEVREDGYPPVSFTNLVGKFGFGIYSSANLHIYDSNGNHMGVNEFGSIEESIPGGTLIAMNGYEYSSILNPEDSYDVEVVGFQEGSFRLDMVIRSDGKMHEFSYPEIDVVNGSVASLSLPDYELAVADPPEISMTDEESVLTFIPEVVEAEMPVEDSTGKTENVIDDVIEGIPGFPILSLGIGLLIWLLFVRKELFS